MIDLYYAATGNGLRAAVALEECGLAFRRRAIDLKKGEQKTPAFLKLNPAGVIPVMTDDDGPGGKPLTLCESGAIVIYAAEKSGKFIPSDPLERAMAWQWFMQATSSVAGAATAIFQMTVVFGEKSPAIQQFVERRYVDVLRVCDQHLAGREYLAGNSLSIADLALYPAIAVRRALAEKAALGNMLRWADMMGTRPAVQRGMQPPA